MINTWIVATIVAIAAGIVGFFVIVRGAAFAAHSLPMGAFSGAAASALLGINQLYGLVVFSGLGILGISQLGKKSRHEVATALSLVALLSTGTLFLSMTHQYSQSVYALLFGEILGINNGQRVPVIIVGALSIAMVIIFFRPLLLNSISPELGEIRGVSSRRMELCFLTALALTTVMALPVVGALLVFSLMIAPPAIARSLTDRPGKAVLYSIGIALITVWASIAIAYVTNWPIGFFVGAFGAVFYGSGRCFSLARAHF
ncbi:metal ABC transporter permease [Martelella alba]|nr:metal ABC transporter permease [Martelella alba]